MHVGLDFGTTNSSAAVYTGSTAMLLPLDPASANPQILRSALYINREGMPYIGREAIDRFNQNNVGREIDYEWTYIGTSEVTFADNLTVQQALYAKIDTNAPGRLFQSLKTFLPDQSFTHTNVFGTLYSLESLIALMLRLIVERIQTVADETITSMVIGRPVHYAGHPDADQLAFERMQASCALAGLPNVTFLEEPIAAALSYTHRARHDQHVLVFDFGGGTLDITVMQLDRQGKRTFLSTDGVPVGGDLLDRRIVMGRLLPYFGAGATIGPRRLPMPAYILEHLSDWQSIQELTQPKYLATIDEIVASSDQPKELRALQSLVRHNYGLPLYEEVERTKVRLSEQPEAVLSMHQGEIDFDDRIPRWEFERLIGPDVREVGQCVDRALHKAGLKPSDIDLVLHTGGSSRVPRFLRMLADKFGHDKIHEIHVFTSVASGLAVSAWERA